MKKIRTSTYLWMILAFQALITGMLGGAVATSLTSGRYWLAAFQLAAFLFCFWTLWDSMVRTRGIERLERQMDRIEELREKLGRKP